jgi:transposase InsO family protein
LALEITTAWWAAKDASGHPKAHSRDDLANPFWGAPRIHGELLKLGIDVGQTTVAKYMAKRRRPPSQGWKTFLHNHADVIASIDMFVVPTVSFRLLYGLLILRHSRRELVWLGVTAHPNAEWVARQVTEAYGWNEAPRYLIRDRDAAYGVNFIRHLAAMGIRDRPSSARSPWQNGHAERMIGSIRRDCLDHVIIFGERHLRYLLNSYQRYYNEVRTHLSVQKDAPIARDVQRTGRVIPVPLLGGLHHQYVRT